MGFGLIETRLGHDVDDKEILFVAVLRQRHTGDDLHRLDGIFGNLIRAELALL